MNKETIAILGQLNASAAVTHGTDINGKARVQVLIRDNESGLVICEREFPQGTSEDDAKLQAAQFALTAPKPLTSAQRVTESLQRAEAAERENAELRARLAAIEGKTAASDDDEDDAPAAPAKKKPGPKPKAPKEKIELKKTAPSAPPDTKPAPKLDTPENGIAIGDDDDDDDADDGD